jgi:hypothetical protein
MLVGPDGVCHAIGVILDGQVNDKGTAERGARFNRTVRYVLGNTSACLGLVVSDDGMVDVVPAYRPLMSKRELERHVDSLREVVSPSGVDQRRMNEITRWIKDHEFYLSKTQCDEINELIANAEPKSDGSAAWCVYQPFEPHPDMNDTYLCD